MYAIRSYYANNDRIGNINEIPLADMAYSVRQERFGIMKEGSLPECCRVCDYQFTCFGECPKNRFIRSESGVV